MKFTLSWLKDHLETDAELDELCEALTDLGFEVEGIEDPSAALDPFTICRVKEAAPHPAADRLRVCRLETYPDGPDGERREVQVVCGAPNARTGLVGVFAPAGTYIPGTELLLKKGVIRGVESHGMLCSEKELMISDDHDGIIDLPEDAPLGSRFVDYREMTDPVIEIAITPNRPDGLGVAGIARDLAARGLGTVIERPVESVEGQYPCPVPITIEADTKGKDCPAFFGRAIRNVRNGESPSWMQRRLRAIGLRPISALVDITNYVTYDRNRPLHVFDIDKLSGGLRIHHAAGGERIVALDGTEHLMEQGMILISDSNGPESIAGITGGLSTGCTAETTNVFLESALWDPITTAATGRKLKISTDARYRFERGVDPEFAVDGLELATRMILDVCGGEASEIGSDGSVEPQNRTLTLRVSRVGELVGMPVDTREQMRILGALGFSPTLESGQIAVTVPTWRPDIGGEADLVEEIARVTSLSRLEGKPLRRPAQRVSDPILTPIQKRERTARRTIASLGYLECVAYSFTDSELAGLFSPEQGLVSLENPISSELDVMRPDLLPNLLRAAARNQSKGTGSLSLFEVGPVFHGSGPGQESLHATAMIVGEETPRNPHEAARIADLFDAKADAETVIAAIGGPSGLKSDRNASEWWHPGRSGTVFARPGAPLAVFGEIHPRVLRKAGIRGRAVAFTVFLEAVPKRRSAGKTRPALVKSPLHPVERDFAFVVDKDVDAADIVRAVRGSRFRKIIENVEVFDEYDGTGAERQFGAGRKSLAIGVRIQPDKSTLKDEEIEAICADIAGRVSASTGGKLRS